MLKSTEESYKKVNILNIVIKNIEEFYKDIEVYFNEIKENTVEVTELVDKQSTAIEEQSQAIHQISENVLNFKKGFEDFMNIVNEITRYTKELFDDAIKTWSTTYNIEEKDFIVESIKKVVDHAIYMNNLFLTLTGKSDWKPADHTQCGLGKWYYAQNKEEIKSKYGQKAYEAFINIEKPHMEFHKIGAESYQYYLNKDLQKAYEKSYKLAEMSENTIKAILDFVEAIKG